jgi:hypothetical protein
MPYPHTLIKTSSFIAMQIAGSDDDEVADDMKHQMITTATLLTSVNGL